MDQLTFRRSTSPQWYIRTSANSPQQPTPLQRQQPQQRVLNCQNSLSTTASFFQPLTKTSGMVLKFDPYGALMINRGNRISIVFHLFCCSMHKLSTIPLANVASLSLFFMLAIWFKKLFKFFFLYFISLYHLRLDYYHGIQQAWTFRINLGFSETDHPPLPWVNIITYFPLGANCWLREGVGGQFPRNLN